MGDRLRDVEVTYITSRGNWYHRSWKGQVEKSGGIATNIGVHFFDMLTWVFGPVRYSTVHLNRPDCAAGHLELAGAHVRWFLSVNADHLPAQQRAQDQRTYRAITVDGAEVEFSTGFTDLHTQGHQHILDGKGFGIDDARQAVDTVYHIRNTSPQGLKGDYHPLCAQIR